MLLASGAEAITIGIPPASGTFITLETTALAQ
jgi:hypothetical protein